MISGMASNSKCIVLRDGIAVELQYCPAGVFMMGSPESEDGRDSDERLHRVEVSMPFWIGRFPITNLQWKSVMGRVSSRFDGDMLPCVKVSWDDCNEFLFLLSAEAGRQFRLPLEAEWEYACRAGTTTAYSWGDALNGDHANCNGERPCGGAVPGPRIGRPVAVGGYPGNSWGLCDMHGNVREWCADWYEQDYKGTLSCLQSTQACRYRVLRGGGWCDDAQDCRSAYRDREEPCVRSNDIGFRICCDAIDFYKEENS